MNALFINRLAPALLVWLAVISPGQRRPLNAAINSNHADLLTDEYLIYSTLLADIKTHPVSDSPVKLFVIGDQTKAAEEAEFSVAMQAIWRSPKRTVNGK
jgi:hypothetical protein